MKSEQADRLLVQLLEEAHARCHRGQLPMIRVLADKLAKELNKPKKRWWMIWQMG